MFAAAMCSGLRASNVGSYMPRNSVGTAARTFARSEGDSAPTATAPSFVVNAR